MDTSLWPAEWPHDSPDTAMSIPEAHATMQRHLGCNITECGRKRAARDVLVDGGRVLEQHPARRDGEPNGPSRGSEGM
ncbi:hypothetical protein K7711_37500 [Nocardia sp. CA2R105]|uniref:hypothetical protein n=1 Tax=Nocardia coffeae TaxID=2873381 RepID=UPI001CA78C79|nr:hypothetical protein [Nocardia coffeae]MBY8862220.1 hypothetical protein [Nocardia coffeae]